MLRIVILAVTILVYVGGCYVLNENIRIACRHGNCIHGWYSKYNEPEKRLYFLWALGVPAVAAIAALAWTSRRGRTPQRTHHDNYEASTSRRSRPLFSAKARKEWTCCECGSRIRRGSSYRYYEIWSGSFSTRHRLCLVCGTPPQSPNHS